MWHGKVSLGIIDAAFKLFSRLGSVRLRVAAVDITCSVKSAPMTMLVRRKQIESDRNGGIEGLPLQLMIIVLIAGISMAIILGWTNGLGAPRTIASVNSDPSEIIVADANGDGLYTNDGLDIAVFVVDNEGKGVEGATVVLEGGGVTTDDGKTPHATTDQQGRASFSSLCVSKYGRSVSFVTVTVVKSNFVSTASLTIPVIAE